MTTSNLLHLLTTDNPAEIRPNRLLGTSTGLAFQYIAYAILNKDCRVVVKDHVDNRTCNRNLMYKIRSLIKHNSLVGFTQGQDTHGDLWVMCSLKTGDKQ